VQSQHHSSAEATECKASIHALKAGGKPAKRFNHEETRSPEPGAPLKPQSQPQYKVKVKVKAKVKRLSTSTSTLTDN